MGQITKAFVTLGFVVGIDDMFAKSLPEGVKANQKKLNQKGKLILKEDYNSFTNIFDRIQLQVRIKCQRRFPLFADKFGSKKVQDRWAKEGHKNPNLLSEFANILVNISYYSIVWTKFVFFSYYTGILCVGIQIAGFYSNMISQDKTSGLEPYPIDLSKLK